MDNLLRDKLIQRALAMRERAYAPYSRMAVGAALLCADGEIFGGCNIENAAFSPTLCAERTALAAAIASGRRDFVALAVAGGPAELSEELPDLFYPCGVCRQLLAEFCRPELPVIIATSRSRYQELTLGQLLPHSFSPCQLK